MKSKCPVCMKHLTGLHFGLNFSFVCLLILFLSIMWCVSAEILWLYDEHETVFTSLCWIMRQTESADVFKVLFISKSWQNHRIRSDVATLRTDTGCRSLLSVVIRWSRPGTLNQNRFLIYGSSVVEADSGSADWNNSPAHTRPTLQMHRGL